MIDIKHNLSIDDSKAKLAEPVTGSGMFSQLIRVSFGFGRLILSG